MVLISVSSSSRWVAKLCRSACSVTFFLIPAASAVSWNRRLNWRVVIGLPGLRPGNNQRSSSGTPVSQRVGCTFHHCRNRSSILGDSMTRRLAHHGYLAICANLYERAGQGDPDDVAAKVRADGGISDAQMVGDTEAAVKWMRAQPNHNGKVGIFGSCSGGRHAFIYACQRKDVDACAELWGGRVVMA